ncbi:DUF3140 domain-containing protein [Aspergillus melleus]|uniref:DUF3140 domain-containing protein n=1 Tax=Aspergillus melleus TaxID=138277 RepID=UPI001E8CE590|nr:uncharacterized protein LDX57_012840 [Aspergillus melleus]KAH8435211.1 hypothetical protein LDX57_012840 [Aspergillus melleus]
MPYRYIRELRPITKCEWKPRPRIANRRLEQVTHIRSRMVKAKETVIDEFNDIVNMTPNELRDWLKEEQSQESGWTNDGSGETVGHESGRKIVNILEHNPSKDPDIYRDQDIDHMRKVVSYCKRHLAQEEKAKQDTESKSYKSLKNWGHDPLKG